MDCVVSDGDVSDGAVSGVAAAGAAGKLYESDNVLVVIEGGEEAVASNGVDVEG